MRPLRNDSSIFVGKMCIVEYYSNLKCGSRELLQFRWEVIMCGSVVHAIFLPICFCVGVCLQRILKLRIFITFRCVFVELSYKEREYTLAGSIQFTLLCITL